MAEGYARVSGRPGVCLVTSGPGATNTVTGIADAYMDSTPIVVITGQVPTSMIGNDAFQEADLTGITRPCTKHNYLIRDVNDVARMIKEAFYIAGSGRPGRCWSTYPKMCRTRRRPLSIPIPLRFAAISRHLKATIARLTKRSRPLRNPNGHSSMLVEECNGLMRLPRSLNSSAGSRFRLPQR